MMKIRAIIILTILAVLGVGIALAKQIHYQNTDRYQDKLCCQDRDKDRDRDRDRDGQGSGKLCCHDQDRDRDRDRDRDGW